MKRIKVLSLFDGIAGAKQALKELSIDCEYYASEVDKFAIEVSKKNHPEIIFIGDVKGIEFEEGWIFYNQNNDPMKNGGSFKGDIDLLIGGSPCQDLSCAKPNGKGLDGEKSSLFFEYVRVLNQVKPKFFVLENVASMKREEKNKISELLGGEPVMIDSALLTAQSRKRVYWIGEFVNGKYEQVKIEQPEDKGILLKDILENGYTERRKSYCITATYSRACKRDYFQKKSRQLIHCPLDALKMRKLTPTECEKLQGFPEGYSGMISNSQRYKALGNSFTVPVIKYILNHLNENNPRNRLS